ncbi:MAG TPA: SDR family oxidoreductase [Candidatus Baltobacteraceae bacterium]|nr:SDR family oxidoreductase [Candidatus Baltobacteraceae bacterium]
MSGFRTQAGGRAWVTGTGGLIGHYLVAAARHGRPPFEVIALTHSDLDITDFGAVERRFGAERPQLIIHCAAMSKSPDCQSNPAPARTVNVDATAHLAALAREVGFIFFSTDLVFDGKKGDYIETDAVNPLSVYGETKVAAEEIVLKNPRHVVVRTSLNSGSSPKGTAYNEQLREGWMRGKTIRLFHDEFRCPIPAAVTARATWKLAGLGCGGMYHLAGGERLSRAQIGQLAAARHPELEARMESCSLREYAGAPRPADTSLNCARIQKLLSFTLPGLTQWLREHPEDVF